MIKALFFDIDGTLLTSSGRMSQKTKEVLKACREKGIKIFIATGRPPLLSKMLELDADEQEIVKDGGVFYNGGCIRLNEVNHYTFLSDEAVVKCVEAILPFEEVNIVVQMENDNHSFRHGLKDEEYVEWGVDKNQLIAFANKNFTRVIKILFLLPNHLSLAVVDKLRASVGAQANVYSYNGGDWRLVEVVDREANKMLGIKRTADIFGWDYDEIAVFGDDFNDVEMLGGFKNSFAMGNACDEVKSHAGNVTLSNNEDGIYHALTQVLKVV